MDRYLNLLIWDVYAFWIKDFSSGMAWAITLIVTVVSLSTIKAKETAESRSNRNIAAICCLSPVW